MQNKLVLFALSFISLTLFGQTYEGYSRDRQKAYHCLFQIRPDSTITYIYNTAENTVYAEYEGRIQQLTDSTYAVKANMAIGQFFMKAHKLDTLFIEMDSAISKRLSKIELEYANGKDRITFDRRDPNSIPTKNLTIPVDKTLFNSKNETRQAEITVNWKNQITRKWLRIKLPYGSDLNFRQGDEIEFEILIKNGVLKSTGNRPTQTGHIKLLKH